MNKKLFGAIAMDLKRVANCYYRGSNSTAVRFLYEDLLRKKEVDISIIKP